jgi:hypothetical protein
MDGSTQDLIREALIEVDALMREAFLKRSPIQPGSALDQAGLENGAEIVHDYLLHGEAGIAFEHLLFMIQEPPLEISRECLERIACAGQALGFEAGSWQTLRVVP